MSKRIPKPGGGYSLPIILAAASFILFTGFFFFVQKIEAGIPEGDSPLTPLQEIPTSHVPVLLPAWFLYMLKPEVSLPIGMAIGGGFIWLVRNAYESNQQLGRVKFKEDVITSINDNMDEHITPRLREVESEHDQLKADIEKIKVKQLEVFSVLAAIHADIHFIYLTREQFLEHVDVELTRVLTEALGTPCKVRFYKSHPYVNPSHRKYIKVDELALD